MHKKGSQTVEKISSRNIVLSKCVGTTNLEELQWLNQKILELSATMNPTWAYIADCSEMNPVSPAESDFLICMTKNLVEAGCQAFTFVDSLSTKLNLQAQSHTERSATGVLEAHFSSQQDALEWLAQALEV